MATLIKDLPPDIQKEILRNREGNADPPPPTADVDDSAAVQKQVIKQLKIQAMQGAPWAVKEYNRLYLPKNGMQSFVEFKMPDISHLDSRGLSKMLIEMLGAVSRRQMSMEQLKELGGIIKDIADTTEQAELLERLETIEEIQANTGSDDFTDADLILLDDYKTPASKRAATDADIQARFKPVPVNANVIGKHANTQGGVSHDPADVVDYGTPAPLDVEEPDG